MTKKSWIVLLLMLGLLGFTGCGGKENKPTGPASIKPFDPARFVVAGSGTNLPVTLKLADAYKSKQGATVEIPPSIGTDGAVLGIGSGALELGLISRPLTPKESQSGLKEIPYARVGIVFGIASAVPDASMTYEELLKVHQGEKKTWSNGRTITVIIREKHDSSNQVLYAMIPGWQDAIKQSIDGKRWHVAYKDAEMPPAIRSMPWSIGLTDSTESLKKDAGFNALRINGVAPTLQNIADGSYPLVKNLLFVYKGELTERSKKFIDFVRSEDGKAVMRSFGAVPIP